MHPCIVDSAADSDALLLDHHVIVDRRWSSSVVVVDDVVINLCRRRRRRRRRVSHHASVVRDVLDRRRARAKEPTSFSLVPRLVSFIVDERCDDAVVESSTSSRLSSKTERCDDVGDDDVDMTSEVVEINECRVSTLYSEGSM